jgi:hypothetical protein
LRGTVVGEKLYTGGNKVYAFDKSNGSKTDLISTDTQGVCSDGIYIYYADSTLKKYHINNGTISNVASINGSFRACTTDGTHLYYTSTNGNVYKIAGTASTVSSDSNYSGLNSVDVTVTNTDIALTNPHSFEKEMRANLLITLWRDLNRSKWEGGGRKWFKSGDEKTHVKFVGEIKNGAPNGMGTSTYPDGSKYEGEWKEGVETGQGTYIFGKGDVRMIELHTGKFKGNKFVGELKEGKFWNGIFSYGSGKKDSKYVNGEKQ